MQAHSFFKYKMKIFFPPILLSLGKKKNYNFFVAIVLQMATIRVLNNAFLYFLIFLIILHCHKLLNFFPLIELVLCTFSVVILGD